MTVKKAVVHLPMEYYVAIKRKSYLCDTMNVAGDYYAKQNNPAMERQIPYDLTICGI